MVQFNATADRQGRRNGAFYATMVRDHAPAVYDTLCRLWRTKVRHFTTWIEVDKMARGLYPPLKHVFFVGSLTKEPIPATRSYGYFVTFDEAESADADPHFHNQARPPVAIKWPVADRAVVLPNNPKDGMRVFFDESKQHPGKAHIEGLL